MFSCFSQVPSLDDSLSPQLLKRADCLTQKHEIKVWQIATYFTSTISGSQKMNFLSSILWFSLVLLLILARRTEQFICIIFIIPETFLISVFQWHYPLANRTYLLITQGLSYITSTPLSTESDILCQLFFILSWSISLQNYILDGFI